MNSKLAILRLPEVTKAFGRLVNLGDQVFSLVITDLIRDLFPNLCVGPSSVSQTSLSFVLL
jgi:dsRNA-specific ribonuclease